jgi:hypothetical protein
MNPLILPATRSTPGVRFEPDLGVFELAGTSIPENAWEFYQPVQEWLAHYLPGLKGEQVLHFRLSYFNSSSFKAIYQLLKLSKDACSSGEGSLRVCWHGDEDDDLLVQASTTLGDLLGLPMNIVPENDGSVRAAG